MLDFEMAQIELGLAAREQTYARAWEANPIASRFPIPRPAPVTKTGTALNECTTIKVIQMDPRAQALMPAASRFVSTPVRRVDTVSKRSVGIRPSFLERANPGGA